jgi:hypothetical protein
MNTRRGRIVLVTLAVVLASLLAPHAEATATWSQTGGSSMTLTGLVLAPDPPVQGLPYTVRITGENSEAVDSASAYYSLFTSNILVSTGREDIGDIPKDPFDLTLHPPTIQGVAPGTYRLEVQIRPTGTGPNAAEFYVSFPLS